MKIYASQEYVNEAVNNIDIYDTIEINSNTAGKVLQNDGEEIYWAPEGSARVKGDLLAVNATAGTNVDVVTKLSNAFNTTEDWARPLKKLYLNHITGSNVLNLLNGEAKDEDNGQLYGAGTIIEKSGVTAIINADHTITISGTATSACLILNTKWWTSTRNTYTILPAGSYTTHSRLMVNLKSLSTNSSLQVAGQFTLTEPYYVAQVLISCGANVKYNETIPFGIFIGNSIPADTSYHGNMYCVEFNNIPPANATFNWSSGELIAEDGSVIEAVPMTQIISTEGTNTFVSGFGVNTISYNTGIDQGFIPDTVPNIQTADVGQVVAVKEVDENGTPTAWETVTLSAINNGFSRFSTTFAYGNTVYINDISGKGHEVKVKVSGVADPTTVKVAAFRRNLIDVSEEKLISRAATATVTVENDGVVCSHTVSGGWPTAVYRIGDYSLFEGKTIVLKSDPMENETKWVVFIDALDASGQRIANLVSRTSNPLDNTVGAVVIPENAEAATLGLRFGIYSAATASDKPAKFKNLQVLIVNDDEVYDIPSDGLQEYTPSSDGTINGINSKYPYMTFITNNVNALLKVEYIKEENDYSEYGLPILFLNGDTSTMTKDNKVALEYVYGGLSGSCHAKWQGSSSIAYPKKNYTITFDTSFEAADGWGSHDKYCLKADWVDFSHCRNVVAAKLWSTVVKSREVVHEKLFSSPNAGAIDGFPCLVVINNKLHGIYNFTIPKDGWLMGMGSGTQEAYLCAEGSTECGDWNAPVVGTDFELEYVTSEDDDAWVQTSLDRLINACNVSSIDKNYIDNTLSQYIDINSAIDYYIFSVLIGHDDGVLKNYLLGTYDGTKWFFSAYDMDLIFGLRYNSNRPIFVDSWNFIGSRGAGSFKRFHDYHKLMRLLYMYKKEEIIARYKELRETILSPAIIARTFSEYASQIPLVVYNEEASLWETRPNTTTNNIAQIISWYQDRVTWLDKEISDMEGTGNNGGESGNIPAMDSIVAEVLAALPTWTGGSY